MTSQIASFDMRLTHVDRDLVKSFRTLLRFDNKTQFSSDDFRLYQLDRFLNKDTAHSIGGFFSKLQHAKLARVVGEKRSVMPSNHYRFIKVYEWTEAK
jgi:hypothetical protein